MKENCPAHIIIIPDDHVLGWKESSIKLLCGCCGWITKSDGVTIYNLPVCYDGTCWELVNYISSSYGSI